MVGGAARCAGLRLGDRWGAKEAGSRTVRDRPPAAEAWEELRLCLEFVPMENVVEGEWAYLWLSRDTGTFIRRLELAAIAEE